MKKPRHRRSTGVPTHALEERGVLPLRTHKEISRILTDRGEKISRTGVVMAEQGALEKLRRRLMNDPDIRKLVEQRRWC